MYGPLVMPLRYLICHYLRLHRVRAVIVYSICLYLIYIKSYCIYFPIVAAQKAKYVMQKLNKLAKGKDSQKPFSFENRGSLAYIGNW